VQAPKQDSLPEVLASASDLEMASPEITSALSSYDDWSESLGDVHARKSDTAMEDACAHFVANAAEIFGLSKPKDMAANQAKFDDAALKEFDDADCNTSCTMSATSNAGEFANEEGSSKTKKLADKKSWEHKKSAPKKSAPKKSAPKKIIKKTPKIVNTSTNSAADAASVESLFESFPVDEEAVIVQDSPLLAAGADMIDPAALMDETERKQYEKRMALMTPEKFAEAKANGVYYSRKDPKRPDLMCQCGKVKRMKNGVHRFRDCQNARCKHLKRGGNGHLFRKACAKCSPHKFCFKCLSSATGEPLRLDQCRCPQGAKVPMARV